MGTPKVMRLLNPHTGLMECKVCGAMHNANLKRGGGYYRGCWQCVNGCKIQRKTKENTSKRNEDGLIPPRTTPDILPKEGDQIVSSSS